jgi:transcriptional regulator with XRE-family HTH domain
MTKKQLGQELRRARKARGILQEEVAKALVVNIRQVGRWEKGENTPNSLALMRLIAFFRNRSDMPDLEKLVLAVAEQEHSAIDARLAEIRRRMVHEPWLLDRLDRLLELTDNQFENAMRRVDENRGQSPDQSSP